MKTNKKITLSASQLKLFKSCPRKHYFAYKLKIRQPSTPALKDGLAFHSVIEHILLEEQFKKDPNEKILDMVVKAFESGCMDFDETEFYVEKKISLDIDDIHNMTGYIDLLLVSDEVVTVVDHKTVKSFKWALTEDQLKSDLQMMVYGKWVIENYKVDRVKFRHNQVNKEDPTTSKPLIVEVSRDDIEQYWKGIEKISPYVDVFRKKETAEEVKTCSGCNDYGGCFYLKEGHCSGHIDKKLQKKTKSIKSKWVKK